MVAFTVEDQGVGIPEDYQQAVFDRFESRPHGSRHRGTGPRPVHRQEPRRAAWRHGRRSTSAPGKGTRVKVLLPLTQEATTQAPKGEATDHAESALQVKPRRMTNSWTFDDVDLVGLDIVASRLALALKPGDVVALSGPLGAGKTTLARALVGRLGGEDEVPSPTFALMQRYETPRLVVTHCDFYRLEPSRARRARSRRCACRRCGPVRMARARGRLAA